MALSKSKKPTGKFARFLMVFGGVVSVVLGTIGIFVPILPTTPFLLLAAYLFFRSSQGLYRWLLTHRVFGFYIKNYIEYRAIDIKIKAFTLILLWGSITYSVYFATGTLWLQVLLVAIAIGVTVHVVKLRSKIPKN
jgi:uncharacterized membrane protein YbaN (DUF454 family)